MEIRLATSALEDLLDMRGYYQEQGVPEVGSRLVAELMEHIERLTDHPDIGRIVPEFEAPDLRELIHPPFRIVYWRKAKHLSIIRIWRSERQLRLPGE